MAKLIIILPAVNEEKTIGTVIDQIPKNIPGIEEIEILVIDDGSKDKTQEIALNKGVEVIKHARNLGLGVTFRRGIERALEKKADIIVNIDADGQFDSKDIPKLIMPILDGRAAFVTASRFVSKDNRPKMPLMKLCGNKLMSFIISKIIGQKFYDVSCGFRAYSRDAALRMNLFGRFTYTQETFIDLAYKGISIVEVPVSVKGEREYGRSKVSSNLFKYGYNTIKIIIVAFRDYQPMKLMSFLSLIFTFLGGAAGGFFIIHYIRTGSFKPHTWAAFLAGAFLASAIVLLFVGIFMDMISRMRRNQERLLYYSRKSSFSSDSSSREKETNK